MSKLTMMLHNLKPRTRKFLYAILGVGALSALAIPIFAASMHCEQGGHRAGGHGMSMMGGHEDEHDGRHEDEHDGRHEDEHDGRP